MNGKRRIAAVALAAPTVVVVAAVAVNGASGASARRVFRGSVPPYATASAKVRPAKGAVHFDVSLPWRNSRELDQVDQAVSDPASPSYGHYLSPAAFRARFSPPGGAGRQGEALAPRQRVRSHRGVHEPDADRCRRLRRRGQPRLRHLGPPLSRQASDAARSRYAAVGAGDDRERRRRGARGRRGALQAAVDARRAASARVQERTSRARTTGAGDSRATNLPPTAVSSPGPPAATRRRSFRTPTASTTPSGAATTARARRSP